MNSIDEKTNKTQYVFVDERNLIKGMTSEDIGVAIVSDIDFSKAENTCTEDGFAKYKLVNGEVIERTEEEIEQDRNNVPMEEPTQLDRIESQVLFTALMTDTLLEV